MNMAGNEIGTPDGHMPSKPRAFEMRVAAMSAAGFALNGLYLPFFPVWLDAIGLAAPQISMILAAAMLARIVSAPFIMAATDRSSERVRILVVISVVSVMCASMFLVARTFALLLAVSVALGVASGTQMPITDSVALSGVRRFGSDYARIRVWGSIAFLVANLAGGYALQRLGPGILPGILFAVFLAMVPTALFMPRLGKPRRKTPLPGAVLQQAGRAFLTPGFLLFMLAAALAQASHAFAYGFSSIYWRSLGINESLVGALWATGVLAEIVLFYAFKSAFGRIRPVNILVAGAVAAVVRWIAFPLVEPAGFGLPGFFLLQTLHALSFGLTYLAMTQQIALSIDEHELGSAQGVNLFLSGFTLAAGIYLSGPLYAVIGGYGFFAMAIVAGAGASLAVAARRWPSGASES